jgi:tRNA pseudouridine38-40 synthase
MPGVAGASVSGSEPVVKLTLEYDGSGFAGWAVQPGLRTVEGTLRAALEEVTGAAPDVSVAGRTDAGVHAWGQVASFAAVSGFGAERLARALNGVLPSDVSAIAVEAGPTGFDARHDAKSRTYCYRVLTRAAPSPVERGRARWWPHRVDEEALEECARRLHGAHDFTAFTPTQTDHVRFEREVHDARWERSGDVLEFWIEADAFMRHMVRVLVGTMLAVSSGRQTPAEFATLLEGAPRSAAGETVETHGLYLASVRY